MTGNNQSQGALAGTIRPHKGMRLPVSHLQVYTPQDRLVIHGNVQILNN
jgi:hypothetical protein